MNTGARDFPAGVQTRNRGTAVDVGDNTTGGVMLRWRDGNEVTHRIDPAHPARLQDGGESVNPGIGAQLTAIEPYMGCSRLAHAPHDRFGDHVSGCKISHRVFPDHEALSVSVEQERALTSHRFGHQGLLPLRHRTQPQHGRVELDEFKIGDSCPRPQSQRRAVTRRHVRVGRLTEYLAETASRQHN